MRNTFTFGSLHSEDYGLYISGNGRIQIPERPYEILQIPGRMGDILLGGNQLSNEIITYPAFAAPVGGSYGNYATYEAAISAFRNDFLSVNGYASLSDTYDTTHYRKAVFTGPIDIDTTDNLKSGQFSISFNCKPQRFLVGGGTSEAINAGQSKTFVCTGKRSAPIFTVTGGPGYFYLTFGSGATSGRQTIAQATSGTIIDCERMEIHDGNGNSDSLIVASTFPQVNKPFKTMETSVTVTAVNVAVVAVWNWYEI